ncbi:MAG: Zn-dependent alcohol dehydrogenase [Alicyclobacillus sp.]|nr:Zn-dependent alcohol dehydrogenase [Alicyclobacillus sp.]
MKMAAALMVGCGLPLEIDDVELTGPRANEVLVKVEATGVCHSDVNALEDPSTPVPCILGHEGAGTVVDVGPGVRTVRPGDRVALSWVPFCGTCEYCQAGQVNLCESAFGPMFAGTLLDGTSRLSRRGSQVYHYSLLSTFAEYTVVPEMSCVRIPDGFPAAQAALIGCGVATGFGAAVRAARVSPGSAVAVFGIGGVGVNAIQGARVAGASMIIACDVKPGNLEAARRFGATHTVNVADVDAVEAIRELTGGYGVQYAIDCTGSVQAAATAWKATRKGGTAVVVGAFPSNRELSLPAGGFHRMGKTLKGSFYGDVHPYRDFPLIAQLYLEGRYQLDELVLSRIPLTEINTALNQFHDAHALNVGRMVVEFGREGA